MYLFFLIFFVFISISLISLILLQSGKGLSNITYSNTRNNIKSCNSTGTNNVMTNIVGIFSCLFLVISIVLCNLNNKINDSDRFWENNKKNNTINKSTSFLNKKVLHGDIPN